MRLSLGEKIFNVCNIIFLTLIAALAIYPFIFVLSSSISDPQAVSQGRVFLFPVGFSLEAYARVLTLEGIWVGYANSIFYAVVGTAVNLVFTTLGAYPLSKKRLRGRGIVTFMVAFTMWFSAGMIPFFLTVQSYGLLNTRTIILFGFAVQAFNMFILRTNFQAIPESLEESAKIDGASDFTILAKMYLPLSMAALATIGLFYFVGRWNSFFWAMVLLRDESLIPLPVLLNQLLVQAQWTEELANVDAVFTRETLIYSTIVVAIVPMMLAFPVLQRYFVKGIMIGSIKG